MCTNQPWWQGRRRCPVATLRRTAKFPSRLLTPSTHWTWACLLTWRKSERTMFHGVQGQFDASWRQVCTLSRYSVSTTKRLSSGSYQPWSKQETSEEGFCCEVTFFWCGINLLSWRWKDLHKNWVEIHNSCPGACGVHLPTWFLFSKSNLFFDFSCYFQRVSSLWCGLNCIIFDSTRQFESTNTSTRFVK